MCQYNGRFLKRPTTFKYKDAIKYMVIDDCKNREVIPMIVPNCCPLCYLLKITRFRMCQYNGISTRSRRMIPIRNYQSYLLSLGFDAIYNNDTFNIHHHLTFVEKAFYYVRRRFLKRPTTFSNDDEY